MKYSGKRRDGESLNYPRVFSSGVRARVCFKLVPDRKHIELYVADLAKVSVDECGVGALYSTLAVVHVIQGVRKRIERASGCCPLLPA